MISNLFEVKTIDLNGIEDTQGARIAIPGFQPWFPRSAWEPFFPRSAGVGQHARDNQ
jgi:hypothetical protein